jgi:hypothetical protein
MMNVEEYYQKKVKIVDLDGRIFIGLCVGFQGAPDYEPEEECVTVDIGEPMYVDLFVSEIASAEIID